jgi:hypothetical protein
MTRLRRPWFDYGAQPAGQRYCINLPVWIEPIHQGKPKPAGDRVRREPGCANRLAPTNSAAQCVAAFIAEKVRRGSYRSG